MIVRDDLGSTGSDGDGVAQIEADHFENAQSVRTGSICAISPRSPSTSMTAAKLKLWKVLPAAREGAVH
jgi:hypothetical protein